MQHAGKGAPGSAACRPATLPNTLLLCVTQAPVRQVVPNYFAYRAPTITGEQSQAIVAGLKRIGLLGEGGYLRADPHEDEVRAGGGWAVRAGAAVVAARRDAVPAGLLPAGLLPWARSSAPASLTSSPNARPPAA